MNRSALIGLAAAAAATAVLVTACSPTTVVSPSGVAARTVSVSSTGTADAIPDAAKASITVEVTNPTSAQTAQADAAAASTKVLEALKAAKVDEKDIATQGIQVGPTYNYTQDGGQTLTGYRASQTLSVTMRDLATAGATLDSVVAAGGNVVRIDSLSPYVTDPTVAGNAARAQAVDIATKQAEQYAKLMGFTLGDVANVTESTSTSPPPPIAFAEAAAPAADKSTPINPGTQQVTVSVNISWNIK
ncbi:MAG: SIMPL domain-containing protein [Actinomycetes bacterium]